MNEAIRELFLTDWVHEATTEEIVKKLVENDERHKEIKRLQQELQRKDNIINAIEEYIRNYYDLLVKSPDIIKEGQLDILYEILDKIKEIESK